MDSNIRPSTIREEIQEICFRRGGYPSAWARHESCPCCGSKRIRYLFSKYRIAHWVCRSCTFVFVNPYPDESTIEALYNASYYPAVRRFIEIPKAMQAACDISLSLSSEIYEEIIASIAKRKRNSGVWLDVGGGIGNFLAAVHRKNPGFDLFLNEMNAESRAFAQGHYNLKVLSDSPETLFRQGFRCDIITMLSVLEHIDHPFEFIKKYGALLNPTGIMMINIPRFSRMNRLFSKSASSNVVPPYHLSLFNEKNLRTLLARTEIFQDIESWQSGPKAFSLVDLMRVAEYFDVEVPREEMPAPKCIQTRSYKPLQLVAIDYLAKYDKILNPIITRLDGRLFLNVAAVKGTCGSSESTFKK